MVGMVETRTLDTRVEPAALGLQPIQAEQQPVAEEQDIWAMGLTV